VVADVVVADVHFESEYQLHADFRCGRLHKTKFEVSVQ
jgi:hypothetical protein